MKKYFLLLVWVAILVLTPSSLTAQTSYGTVAGSVTDSTGAAVPKATVTVKSRDTGESRTIATSSAGGFRIESLGSGHYDITVTATGFAVEVIQDVTVNPSVTTSVTPTLKIGKNTDIVEVSGSNEILQTESGEVSATIGGKEIADLPINSLNAYTLVTTLPGVTTVTEGTGGNGPKFSANGARPRANNYLIEGQDNNDAGLTGQGLQPQNTEAMDSVTFLLNSYQAEFGFGGGAISNLVFKSGTNRFHGSVYDRVLNSSLNATDHNTTFNGGVKSKFRENIYGFTLGGPIFKNKLFMFGAYQQDHYRSSSQLSTLVVPTAAGYATLNKFASNPRVANLIKAYGGLVGYDAASGKFPTAVRTIALGPDPVTGIDRGSVDYGGFQRTASNGSNGSELDLKADYLATPADKIQFRLIRSYSSVPYDVGNFPSQLPFFDTTQGGPAYNAGIVEDHTFSSHLLNELRISYSRIAFVFDLRPDTYTNPLALGPTVSIASVTGYGIPTSVPQGRSHNTYQLQDGLTYAFGNHSVKFGFDLNQTRVKDNVPFTFYGTINYQSNVATVAAGAVPATAAYSGLANYIDDFSGYTSATGQAVSQQFGSNVARPTLTEQNYYVQDHWKATSRLALDYGIRYEYTGAPFNYLAAPATDFASPFTSNTAFVKQKPNYMNFAPRVGFAFTAADKTVVRGGFGMFYDHTFTNIVDNIQASAPNAASPIFYGNRTVSGRGTPNFSQQFANLSKTPLPTNSQTTIKNDLKNPLSYQYNLAIEQALPGSMSLTVGYVGTNSRHLYSLETLNPVVFGGARVNASRGLITAFANSGDSNYNGLQLQLDRKSRKGLFARVSYTYAKDLDDVSDPYSTGTQSGYPEVEATLPTGSAQRGRDWGPSTYDHKQRAVLSLVYNTPTWHAQGFNKVLANIVNHYTVGSITSFQTGSVINYTVGFDVNGDGITNDRPVLLNKNAPLNTYAVMGSTFYAGIAPGVLCDGRYVGGNAQTKNVATGANDAFCHVITADQAHFYFGDYLTQNRTVSRNADYTPGTFQFDADVQRSFKLYEGLSFNFRAEVFNVLNHANTGIPAFTLYGSNLLPDAPGYAKSGFNNYAASASGARNLRFFAKFQF